MNNYNVEELKSMLEQKTSKRSEMQKEAERLQNTVDYCLDFDLSPLMDGKSRAEVMLSIIKQEISTLSDKIDFVENCITLLEKEKDTQKSISIFNDALAILKEE